MTTPLTEQQVMQILNYPQEQRVAYSFKKFKQDKQIWILTDEHGCMMLNTEEEDCVPVWPDKAFAERWINDDWKHCQAEAIGVNKWRSRWTNGLLDDDLAIVVFPNENEEGLVVFPDEFDVELGR